MLSRVADSMFWMSRYIERADNCARMLNVNIQLLLDCQKFDERGMQEYWEPILSSLGCKELFWENYKSADSLSVTEFVTFNELNLFSISNCISIARENARMVRGQLSSGMWEELNKLYLYINSKNARKDCKNNPYEFYNKIIDSSHLFQGLTDSTIVRDEGWEFIQIGKFLERADQTTRMLDVRSLSMQSSSEVAGSSVDVVHWSGVLRSCSAQESYHQIYVTSVDPTKVSEFLLLSEIFPRSIRFCMQMVHQSLCRLTGVDEHHYSNDADRLAGRLLSDLDYSLIDEILKTGLHEYLDQIQVKLLNIGNAMHSTYFYYQNPTVSMESSQTT